MITKNHWGIVLWGMAFAFVLRGCRCMDFDLHLFEGECPNGRCDWNEDHSSCPQDCFCGDGVLSEHDGEECDGTEFNDLFFEPTCKLYGCISGTLRCSSSCKIDLSHCTGCPDTCGDGNIDGSEECEGSDLGGMTCQDLDCSDGTLRCNDQCAFDLSGCRGCSWTQCGNGLAEVGEECDCGTDPTNLPESCSAVNGDPKGECMSACTLWPACDQHLMDETGCRSTPFDLVCCPDAWGNESACFDGKKEGESFCALLCASTDDCHYNGCCDTQSGGCVSATCGPNGIETTADLHQTCHVPEGGEGYCMPIGTASDELGICHENSPNALPPGAPCVPGGDTVSFPRDVGMETCAMGLCVDQDNDGLGKCLLFCNWEDVYDNDTNSLACPIGHNCFGASTIDPVDPDPATGGMRGADLGFCVPDESADASGFFTCDLVNGELIGDRTLRCSDLGADRICAVRKEGASAPAWGSLIGWCRRVSDPSHPGAWEVCNPYSSLCDSGVCLPEDIFSASPSGPNRCIPFCASPSVIRRTRTRVRSPTRSFRSATSAPRYRFSSGRARIRGPPRTRRPAGWASVLVHPVVVSD